MTNAEQFERIFGFYATELWSLPEEQFLRWLNAEAPKLEVRIKPITNNEILEKLYGEESEG